ncbi:hypothetical protein HHK36_000319 [Tetracentron sinense]|uniref:CHORD domain-containing protein n=1 Tax=Tetracentron sinense TaxID=13715 RepID=A0A835A0S3_TETSI|nr:hypothetical protein HHK36_000319 [Tetracentron sinense]
MRGLLPVNRVLGRKRVSVEERESMEKQARVRCQRIGCEAMFTEDDNPDDSCRYHASPIFHDGMKEWSCCKKRSHDFSLFLALPGCKTGKHTTEKPVITKATAGPRKPIPAQSPATDASSKLTCSRCRQGFFCSEHGSQAREVNLKPVNAEAVPAVSNTDVQKESPAPAKKIINLNQPQTCRNKGCGRTFKEKDNHEDACNYHPGPAVFHDRMRGVGYLRLYASFWQCCDIHVKEFDEFMNIPPCTKGWHSADPVS